MEQKNATNMTMGTTTSTGKSSAEKSLPKEPSSKEVKTNSLQTFII